MKNKVILGILLTLILGLVIGLGIELNQLRKITTQPTIDKIILPKDQLISYKITLNPPIQYPNNIDELYQFIEEERYGWTFEPCHYYRPFINWGRVVEIGKIEDNGQHKVILSQTQLKDIMIGTGVTITGKVNITEDELFGNLIKTVIEGKTLICGDTNKKPVIYGSGVQDLFNRIMQ
jgi:hypothetical protein